MRSKGAEAAGSNISETERSLPEVRTSGSQLQRDISFSQAMGLAQVKGKGGKQTREGIYLLCICRPV